MRWKRSRAMAVGIARRARAEEPRVRRRRIALGSDGLVGALPEADRRARNTTEVRGGTSSCTPNASESRRTGSVSATILIQRLAVRLLVEAGADRARQAPEDRAVGRVAGRADVAQAAQEDQIVPVRTEPGRRRRQRLVRERAGRRPPLRLPVALDREHADELRPRGTLRPRLARAQQRQAGGAQAEPREELPAREVPVLHGRTSPADGNRWVNARVRLSATRSSRRS